MVCSPPLFCLLRGIHLNISHQPVSPVMDTYCPVSLGSPPPQSAWLLTCRSLHRAMGTSRLQLSQLCTLLLSRAHLSGNCL